VLREVVTQMAAEGPLGLQEAYDLHTALIHTDAIGLIVDVGNAAKIIRDPDVDTYWLMDHVILKAPALRETLSKVRALTAIALSAEGSIAERTLLRSQSATPSDGWAASS